MQNMEPGELCMNSSVPSRSDPCDISELLGCYGYPDTYAITEEVAVCVTYESRAMQIFRKDFRV